MRIGTRLWLCAHAEGNVRSPVLHQACHNRASLVRLNQSKTILRAVMSKPASIPLAKRLLSLSAWYLLTLFLVDGLQGFRGDRPLFYYAMPLVPAAIFFNARHFPTLSFPFCYGLICGWTFGYPRIDPRAYYWGLPPMESMIEHTLLYTFFSVVVCLFAFGMWILTDHHTSPKAQLKSHRFSRGTRAHGAAD